MSLTDDDPWNARSLVARVKFVHSVMVGRNEETSLDYLDKKFSGIEVSVEPDSIVIVTQTETVRVPFANVRWYTLVPFVAKPVAVEGGLYNPVPPQEPLPPSRNIDAPAPQRPRPPRRAPRKTPMPPLPPMEES